MDPRAGSWKGCSSAGREQGNSRSHASEPIDATTDSRLAGSRNPIARTSPEMSARASCTAASPPSSMVATRKMADGVSGARIGCGWTPSTSDPNGGASAMMANMSASPQGLCDFIDASPSPFHVCLTVAQRLRAVGFTELWEGDEGGRPGRATTTRCASAR